MCYGGIASQNSDLLNKDVIVDDGCEDGNDDYDDRLFDCYEGDDIYKLFPEVCDFRKHFPSNFVFAHVNLNSLRHT